MNRWMIAGLLGLMGAALGAGLWLPSRDGMSRLSALMPAVVPSMRREPLRCSYGMAPVAFEAFVRACLKAHVSPHRLTQTMFQFHSGAIELRLNKHAHRLSGGKSRAFVSSCEGFKVSRFQGFKAGCHHRDGVWRGMDYCAATDIHDWGLSEMQVARLNMALFSQGFASWYRHGGKWTGGEHIHAVYAFLPMKPQLQGQVRLFFQQRRHARLKPLKWERKWKRQRRHLRFSR